MTKIEAVYGMSETTNADAVIIYVFQDENSDGIVQLIDEALQGIISSLLEAEDFSGKSGEISVLYTYGRMSTPRIILVGLGNRGDLTLEGVRNATARVIKKAASLKLVHVATIMVYANSQSFTENDVVYAIAEATVMTLYQYHGQKSDNPPQRYLQQLDIVLADEAALSTIQSSIDRGIIVAESVGVARDLVNLPANYCTPEYMAAVATEVASESGLQVQILDEYDIREARMGALLSVSQGSETPPRFIILEHNAHLAETAQTVVLVGKGVTFDTGGYTIKSRDGMAHQKADMAGGAAVLGAMRAIAQLDIPLHVVGLVPSADNMISGNAFRPQDVFTASNGKTIEIVSTDAEGRMLLADALVYADRYDPAAVVDIATLTGACFYALGGVMAGLYTQSKSLRNIIMEAGDATHERVWPMPLDAAYEKGLKSDTADTKNSVRGAGGGSVAGMFLRKFTQSDTWAHIDMAGIERGRTGIDYIPNGSASGYGVRLLTEVVRLWAES